MAYGYSRDDGSFFDVKEAYRTVRTNLMFSLVKKGCKRVVFTSAVQAEGKTTTAANVAFSIARNHRKVLLIDLDLRRPRINRLLKVSNTPWLSNYLSGFNSLEEVLHRNVYENLDLVCAGTLSPNPAELIASDAMADFLKEAEQHYDYIIIDTAPVNVVSDALPVIKTSDGGVLVTREKYSNHTEIRKAIERIKFIEGKVLGVVVNGTHEEKRGYGRYGKKYGYGYGYGEKNASAGSKSADPNGDRS